MSPSVPLTDYAAPGNQEFLAWVPKHCIYGTNGLSAIPNRPFMPLPDLEAYLKAESRISKLLSTTRYLEHHQDTVEDVEGKYLRIFTILTLIGKGAYIEHFVEHDNLSDTHLPFLSKPAHFPIDPADKTFWDSFFEKQFVFCAHHFHYYENYKQLEELCILPIISKELLAHGGSAALYKIKLHPFYDKLNPTADANKTYSARPANTHVLKTYNTKDAHDYYKREVDAFKRLTTKNKSDQSLIQLLGSYRQGDTYNVLLEYADRGTLEDFFQKQTPPSLDKDIIMFWDRLFNVIQALCRIHTIERPDSFRGPDILVGWHQDVKPKNILILSGKSSHPYDVEVKLADLGLSHFKRVVKLDKRIVDSDIGGTKDYGAPECHRSDEFLEQSKLNVKPSVDIWSFGGVCSEAAVWVVLGMSGLTEYRNRRQQEICEMDTSQDGSCFHDGENVLKTVESMHDRLLKRGEIRPEDHVTKAVIDHMISNMLTELPDTRQNALWLWKKCQSILREAQLELKKSSLRKSSGRIEPMADEAQFFTQNISNMPPQTLQERNSHPHGPPPLNPRYSSNTQVHGRPLPTKDTLMRRSDTWHEHGTNTDLAPGQRPPLESPPLLPRSNMPAAGPPNLKTKPSKPYLSYKVAKDIRERHANLQPAEQNLLNDLKDRDHVFLIDDSLSMKDHWEDVISLFSVFAYFAKKLDSNGLEMCFTVSSNKESFKNTSPAVSQLKSMTQTTCSNINLRLGQILRKYQVELERQEERNKSFWMRGKAVKPLSLYVFTDAAWQGCDAVAPIEAMIEKQKQLELPKEQVGIQFIRFGNDPTGMERLEYLDSGLRRKYTKRWDIVDTEPFPDGNLLKMLLGAISEWFDDD